MVRKANDTTEIRWRESIDLWADPAHQPHINRQRAARAYPGGFRVAPQQGMNPPIDSAQEAPNRPHLAPTRPASNSRMRREFIFGHDDSPDKK
ncbi:MAG: hypothetical protein JSS02_02125, partial [Planctomycetes bacterium]|nr:hypothetical protein [Planctomycetota bacterium]